MNDAITNNQEVLKMNSMESLKLWRVTAEKTNGMQSIMWYYSTQEAFKYAIKMQDDLSVKYVKMERI